MSQDDADKLRSVPPAVGAEEFRLTEEFGGYTVVPLQVEGALEDGRTVVLPGMLYRFTMTPALRARIAAGEDVFVMLVAGEPVIELELQVGAGRFQVTSPIVGVDGRPIARDRPQLEVIDGGQK